MNIEHRTVLWKTKDKNIWIPLEIKLTQSFVSYVSENKIVTQIWELNLYSEAGRKISVMLLIEW